MKLKKLIAWLESFEGNPNVYLSSDAEGNSYHDVANQVGTFEDIKTSLILFPTDEQVEFE